MRELRLWDRSRSSLQNPMSDQDLEVKFRSLVEGPLGKKNTDTLIAVCRSVEDLSDIGDIARAASVTI
jgi:hypothetical protein